MAVTSTTAAAASVAMVARQHTAAYVGARCAIWPGPPPNPPSARWHSAKNATTSSATSAGRASPSSASACVIQ